MHRILSLACALLLFTAALPLLAQPEVAPPPPPQPAPAPPAQKVMVIKKFDLQCMSTTECMTLFQTTKAQGGMKELVPKGVVDLVGLVGLNAVLVRAENEQALDQMELLLRMIDVQAKQFRLITVELLAVELPAADAEAILAKRTQLAPREGDKPLIEGMPDFNGMPSIEKKRLMEALGPIIDGQRGSMRSMKRIIQSNPHGGVIDLREWQLSHEALWYFGVRTEQDELVLFAKPVLPVVPEQVETILGVEPPFPLHIAQGHAVLVDSQPMAGDANRRQLLFLALDGFMDGQVNGETVQLPPLF